MANVAANNTKLRIPCSVQSKYKILEGRKLSMQAVSHFHSELGLFMMFSEICFIVYFDEL